MSTLTGQKPKDTYKGLIKTLDSGEVSSEKQLSDGDGNALPVYVSTTGSNLTGDARVNGQKLGGYIHNQSSSELEWTINHNMNKNPSVTIVDSANTSVVGEVEYLDKNALVVRFKSPFKGKAFLN